MKKRSCTIELQVFLLLFYLNREPHLALSLSKESESPSLWRRGRPLGDTEGFTLDDLKRKPKKPAFWSQPAAPTAVGQAVLQRII